MCPLQAQLQLLAITAVCLQAYSSSHTHLAIVNVLNQVGHGLCLQGVHGLVGQVANGVEVASCISLHLSCYCSGTRKQSGPLANPTPTNAQPQLTPRCTDSCSVPEVQPQKYNSRSPTLKVQSCVCRDVMHSASEHMTDYLPATAPACAHMFSHAASAHPALRCQQRVTAAYCCWPWL